MLKKILLNVSIEFGPIVAFLIASEVTTFVKATIIFVVLTAIALTIGFIERREIAPFPLIVGFSVILFGVLTIYLHDPFYIIVKDTLYNGAFALVLFTGLFFNKGLLKPLFKGLFAMSDHGWRILSLRWGIMFSLLAISNEIVRVDLSPSEWVDYKAIATVATIIFSVYQFRLAKKERLPDSTAWGMRIHAKKS